MLIYSYQEKYSLITIVTELKFSLTPWIFQLHGRPSEYKASDSDRKVNRNIYPDVVTRDRMRLIDPKSGQLEPIHNF